MGLSYGFLLQFLLAGHIGFYNGPDLARGPPIKNPCPKGSNSERQLSVDTISVVHYLNFYW